MNVTLAYLRASTDRQDFGLEAQTEACQRAAEFQQLGPLEIFAEPDVSGSRPFLERPEARRLLGVAQQAVAHGDTVTVIVPKVDRLARDTVDVSNTARLFEQLGVRLILLDINVDTRSPMGRAFMQIAAVFAELELARIKERITDVMESKRESGILTGTIPYGWDTEPTGETSAKGVEQFRLVDNVAEQEVIRRMIAWRNARWGYHSIANELNREGHKTKRGKAWNSAGVRKILLSRTVRDWLAATATAATALAA